MTTEAKTETTPEQPKRRTLTARRREVPVDIECLDGVVRTYTIRQMDGANRDEHNQFQNERFATVDGRNKVTNWIDFQSTLIARMLFDDKGKQVPISTIRAYPDETVEELHAMCSDFAELDGNGFVKAKND